MTDSIFWRPLASISECFNWYVKPKGVSGNPWKPPSVRPWGDLKAYSTGPYLYFI